MLRFVVEVPLWLAYPDKWPSDIVTSTTKETQAEAQVIKEVCTVTMVTSDELEPLPQKWNLRKTIRVGLWVAQYIRNCRVKRQQRTTVTGLKC